jgi:hypothetical protein
MVRLMHIAWERNGTTLKRLGLRAEWEIADSDLEKFNLPGADPLQPFSEVLYRGILPDAAALLSKKGAQGRINLRLDGNSPGIQAIAGELRQEFDLHIRMVPAQFFAAERTDANSVAELLMDIEADVEPTDFVLLGITDAALDHYVNKDLGSGVDQILNPGLLAQLAQTLPVKPRVAIAVTGYERELACFDSDDPRWSAYGSQQRLAWDPRVVQYMLRETLRNRPHLQNLLLNDKRFRASQATPLTMTAVMPCGFLSDWGCLNYNPSDPGWIEGSPAIRGEKEAPYFIPYCCADPLLTALTGITSLYQLTPDNAGLSRPYNVANISR